MSTNKEVEEIDYFIKNARTSDLAEVACTVSVWDFNTSLGGTIVEKYETMYVKILEISNVMIRKGAKGFFWLICSPEVSSVLEFSFKLREERDAPDYMPMGISEKQCIGILDKRWRVYVDPMMNMNHLIIGCGSKPSPEHIARMSIANYII